MAAGTATTDGVLRMSLTVENTGDRAGAEVVQLYLHDPVASVVRPVQRLVGFHRVELEPGASVRLEVEVPADLAAFTGRDGRRIVEPGVAGAGRSGARAPTCRWQASVELAGPMRVVDHTRAMHPVWTAEPLSSDSP